MIDWNDFERVVISNLNRNISRQSNLNQNDAIQAPFDVAIGPEIRAKTDWIW